MQALFDDTMVQAGVAPFAVALAVAALLSGWRLGWLGIVAALATTIALSTGITFSPLTAGRKAVLMVLLAPLVGLVADRVLGLPAAAGAVPVGAAARHEVARRPVPAVVAALALLAGGASLWVFWSVVSQRDGVEALLLGGGVALFVGALVALVLRLAGDGGAAGAAALGLGLAVGVGAVLSASIGNLMNGIALAAAGGALLLLQFVRNAALAPGQLGALSVGLAAALFAASTFVLAELRWYSLVLLLTVPAVAALPVSAAGGQRARLLKLTSLCVAASAVAMLVAWLATRFPANPAG